MVEEDDIAANGPRYGRIQNGLEAEVELLRRQLQALIEQLRRDRKIQQKCYQYDTARNVALYEEDYEQPFVHIPRWRREVWPQSCDRSTKDSKPELGQDLRLNSLNLMAAWIMRSLCIGF